jgi:hypothetical protein
VGACSRSAAGRNAVTSAGASAVAHGRRPACRRRTAAGGATCTPSGSGAVHDLVDLPPGGRVTYTATGTAATAGTRSATVTLPAGVIDPDPGDNSGG